MRLNYFALVIMGLVWGVTPILAKLIIDAGHSPLGVLVWTMTISVLLSGAATFARGKPLPIGRRYLRLYLGITLLGQVLPHFLTYTAVGHLPAGIVAIGLALVPMFAMPIALMLGFERVSWKRVLGTVLGALAIVMIVGPETGLPDPSKAIFVVLVLLAALCYGGEGNFLTWYGDQKLDVTQILFGASVLGLVLTIPFAAMTEAFINPFNPWGLSEWLIVLTSSISWLTYVAYIWLIGRAGPVFAAQVAYLVTGFGVFWSIILLGEQHSLWVWVAFALMFAGISLVQPRDSDP